MAEKLLVRAYDVGLGDCIYVRIPDNGSEFHMLVDCGTLGERDLLRAAFENLKTMLPVSEDDSSKRRLDLLVITHRHKDHIIGAGMDIFDDIDVKHIWLSAAMDKSHKQAEGLQNFSANVQSALKALDRRGLSPALNEMVAAAAYPYEDETEALEGGLGVEPKYVHASTPAEDRAFNLQETSIQVIAPEKDIDGYYLGDIENGGAGFSLTRSTGLTEFSAEFARPTGAAEAIPTTISLGDFQRLRSRMMYNALAFAYADNSFRNNTSVVLLVEWRGKRLLFTGDAEWHGAYKKGKQNGSWNVMWKKRKHKLNGRLDFLKVGHHGSENATPWNPAKADHEVNEILDSILPVGEAGETFAIVSTQRANYASIPGVELVRELGRRVSNVKTYSQELSQDQKDSLRVENPARYAIEGTTLPHPQPERTDFEALLSGENYVDVEIEGEGG